MAFSIIEVFFIMRASKVALSILERHGVQTIFGYPGSNNLSIYDDLIGSTYGTSWSGMSRERHIWPMGMPGQLGG